MTVPTRKKAAVAAGAALVLAATVVGVSLTAPPAQVQAQPVLAGVRPSFAGVRPAVVNQQQPNNPNPKPDPKPGHQRGAFDPAQRQADMQQRRQAYLDALAGRLGVSKDQLGNAMKQARIDQINKAVAEGRLDQERANRIIQAIQSGQRFQRPAGPNGADANQQGGPPRGPGQRPDGRPVGPPGSPMEMRGEGMLAANVLGMTPQELRAAMMAGKSLAQIAQDKGISRDDLKAKLIAAQKTRLDQAVSEGRMSADQAKQIADRFAANVDRQIDMVPGQRRGPQRPAGTN